MKTGNGMGAVIIPFFLLFAGIIFVRELWWLQANSVLQREVSVTLSEPIKLTISQCIITHEGREFWVPRHTCDENGLQAAAAGDKAVLIDTQPRQLTDVSGRKRTVYAAQKLHFYNTDYPAIISYWWWVRILTGLHQKIVDVFYQSLPEPEAGLVAGIVIGEQVTLSSQFKAALKQTGTMHIVAASGYNVMVVAAAVMALAVRWWGRRAGLILTGFVIWGYVLLAGGTPPIVRAGLMAIIMIAGTSLGRVYWAGWALVVAGGAMLLVSPWLMTSVSWQLSVAATAGVLWGTKPMTAAIFRFSQKLTRSIKPKHKPAEQISVILKEGSRGMIDAGVTTLAATLMTAPVSLVTFGSVSWWGLVVNPFVLWLVPPLMALGSWLAVLGIIWIPLAGLGSWVVMPVARLMTTMIMSAAAFPVSMIGGNINWWMVAGWWLCWIAFWHRRDQLKEINV